MRQAKAVDREPGPSDASAKRWVAIVLAWIAGGVDAVGYLTLLHLFTAHMSGNSVAFAASLGAGHWREALWRLFAIPFFLLGVGVGAAVAEATTQRRVPHRIAVGLTIEAAALAVFMILGLRLVGDGDVRLDAHFYALAAAATLGMGVQNGVLRRINPRAKGMTYMTGLLTTMTEEIVAFFFWLPARRRARATAGPSPLLKVRGLAAIFAGYVIGATMCGLARQHVGFAAVALPLAGLLIVIVTDLGGPLPHGSVE